MKARITKIQPNKFQNNLVCPSRTTEVGLQNNSLLIGRGEQLQKQQNTDTYSVNHRSISRKHVSITLPYYLYECNKNIMIKSIKNMGGNWVPKYYFKLGGIFEKLTNQLLGKIRQYCQDRHEIVINDLISKYGLYRQINTIQLTKKQQTQLLKMKINNNNQRIKVLNNQKNCIIQMGNQNIQIIQCQNNLTYAQMKIYTQKIVQKLQQIKFIYDSSSQIIQNPKLQYYSIIINHYSQQHKQTHNYFCIILSTQNNKISNKISIGRHAQCNIQINKSEISRKQINLYVNQNGNWIIEDNKSTNGTWIKCNKIIYDLKELYTNKQVQCSSKSISFQLQNLCQQTNINSQFVKPLQIKIGQVRLKIQIQGVKQIMQNLNYNIKYNSIKQYPTILAQFQKQSYSKSQSMINISQNQVNKRIDQVENMDQLFQKEENKNQRENIQKQVNQQNILSFL